MMGRREEARWVMGSVFTGSLYLTGEALTGDGWGRGEGGVHTSARFQGGERRASRQAEGIM